MTCHPVLECVVCVTVETFPHMRRAHDDFGPHELDNGSTHRRLHDAMYVGDAPREENGGRKLHECKIIGRFQHSDFP